MSSPPVTAFRYEAVDARGKARTGIVDAHTPRQVSDAYPPRCTGAGALTGGAGSCARAVAAPSRHPAAAMAAILPSTRRPGIIPTLR